MHVVLSHQVWSNRYSSTWTRLPWSPSWMPLLACRCCRIISSLENQRKSFLPATLRHWEASATSVISIEGVGLSGLSRSGCRNSWATNAHFSLASGHGPTPSLVIQAADGRENSMVSQSAPGVTTWGPHSLLSLPRTAGAWPSCHLESLLEGARRQALMG